MMDILEIQKSSTLLIVNQGVKRIFVDGGFSKNSVVYEFAEIFISRIGSLRSNRLSIYFPWRRPCYSPTLEHPSGSQRYY